MSSSRPSHALTKRAASDALMPPPPAPKRIKRPTIVLDEDTYTSAIAHIIRRDFFPGLEETDAQREYLNALDSKDNTWIREAGKRLTQAMTPLPSGRRRKQTGMNGDGFGGTTPAGRGLSETPRVWGSDTPLSIACTENVEDEEKKPEVDLNLSLSAFQAKYTSEDTESFSRIIDKQNAKKFEKNAWMRDGNRFASKQRVAQQKVIKALEDSSISQALTLRPSEDLDARPAAPTMHKHTAFNTLMFAPDSIESWVPTRAQQSATASLAPPKAVLHHNTRLPIPESSAAETARPPSPTISAVRDAIAGRTRNSEAGVTSSETPRMNGYRFVNPVAPGAEGENEDEAPTDLLEKFGAKGSHATPFTIHDSNRREKLHHKMVERINSTNHNHRTNDTSTSGGSGNLGIFHGQTPRFLSAPTPVSRLGMTPGTGGNGRKGVGNLTPAAQRLFEKVGGSTPQAVGAGGFGGGGKNGSALGREWTPTPRVKRRA